MPAKHPLPPIQGRLAKILLILFTFVFPLLILTVGIYFATKAAPSRKRPTTTPAAAQVLPSQVLAAKGKYTRQSLVINGRIYLEPVICEQIICPPEDSCCGCPTERNLAISDPDVLVSSNVHERLRLIDVSSAKPFCTRKAPGCDYECPGWTLGNIYDVTGTFFAEAPPPGWKLYLNFYFAVSDKKLAKAVTTESNVLTVINNLIKQVKDFASSGSYVLQ